MSQKAITDALNLKADISLVTDIESALYNAIVENDIEDKAYVDEKIATIPQANWNQNDETAKDFIQGRTHYKTNVYKNVLDIIPTETERTTQLSSGRYRANLPVASNQASNSYPNTNNILYCVIYNGVEYYRHAYSGNNNYIGNINIYDSTRMDTGEPFCIMSEAYGVVNLYTRQAETFTIKIYEVEESTQYVQLDEKFIPDSIARTVEVDEKLNNYYLKTEADNLHTEIEDYIDSLRTHTDASLSQAGVAADAKVVGDKFTEISSTKVNLPLNTDGSINYGVVGCFAISNGEGGVTWLTETDEKYFDIDYDGIVSLKAEYRGASNQSSAPYSISDNGLDAEGSKINELPERIVIPSIINEIAVTGFQNAMFYRNTRVKEIILPDGITKLPNNFCREAKNLVSVKNTENVTILGNSVFNSTRIEKASFPNLISLGNSTFSTCVLLVSVDIGNLVTEVPKQCFMACHKLSYIFGGASVTSVGDYGFFYTVRLKNLPFLSQLTNVGNYGFFYSRVNFDWNSLKDCTFGTYATWSQYNSEDYWSACTYTACEKQLLSLFNQHDTRWCDETIGNTTRKYIDGCAMICIAEIYSAFEGVELSSPKDFEAILNNIDSSLLDLDTAINSNMVTVLKKLGYNVTSYTETISETELQEIYDTLANGALLYKSVATSSNINGGHAIIVYGLNSIGELMISDS